MTNKKSGKIFTFYSYKGGSGRSMALANIASLLAKDSSVLMLDWDLEAPGLHRFYSKYINSPKGLFPETQDGLIDLFVAMEAACEKQMFGKDIPDSFFDDLEFSSKYVLPTTVKNLFLMTAGKFDKQYSTRVNTFDWERLFNKNPWLISEFANYLSKKYDYVLIDSRTGFTDTSSVCTALMPEKLVLVFTPNNQSISGVVELSEKVVRYRRNSNDTRPLSMFPLVSRVENAEQKLQADWRFGNKKEKITGYQVSFENVIKKTYELDDCDLTEYFDEIQIQYVPKYSYGEEIAVLADRSDDRLSLARSYESLNRALIRFDSPWEYQKNKVIELNAEIDISSNIYIGGDVVKGDKSGRDEINLKVFLVHGSTDKESARELYEKLKRDGFSPWLDEQELLPGQDWNREINKAVKEAHVVLVLLSSQSVSKEGYVQKEIRYALDLALGKPEGTTFIIPVRLDECDVPRLVMSWQYVDYFPSDRKDWAYNRLVKSLKFRQQSIK